MKRPTLLSVLVLFVLLMGAAPLAAVQDGPGKPERTPAPERQTFVKAIAPPGLDLDRPGITLWHDYSSFALYRISADALARLPASVRGQLRIDAGMDNILFSRRPLDTRTGRVDLPASLMARETSGAALHLVQFVGPIKQAWLDAVVKAGGAPVQYIANNAYLVWADAPARDRLAALADAGHFVQYSGPYQPGFKLGQTLEQRILAGRDPDEIVPVEIQIFAHAGKQASQARIAGLAVARQADWWPVLAFENSRISVRAADLLALARLPDVVWLGEQFPRERSDETQTQILAARFNAAQSGPDAPGYLPWLDSLGFSQDPAAYPIISITDDGIGNGSPANGAGDDTLTRLRDGVTTRLAFVANCTEDASGDGQAGHGHINASIAGGYDTRAGFPFQDPNGYQRGLGVNPYGRLAGIKIFTNDGYYDDSACGGGDTGVIKRQQDNGALISSNSWGCGQCADLYDLSSQAYDVAVRDADLTEAGQQQMTFIFAAGNDGDAPGTVGSPGNGKNIITVGASENDRPSDEDGDWVDGCSTFSYEADNAMDVVGFSSRGPAPGGRVKPEVIAPGTHIQGAASTQANYDGTGVCDQYRPGAQTVFAASSGTSHSTPAVAGVASLYAYWLQKAHNIAAPSPALLKAYLLAHPTYLTGVSAGDTLPSNTQGYGMPDLRAAFDDTSRAFMDQSVTFDNSGDTWRWSGEVTDPARPLRIVLAYTDAAGSIGVSPHVNDLNLTAVVDGVTYLGNHFSGAWSAPGGSADAVNNYEAVFLPAGASGRIQITVTGFNIAGDGVPGAGDGSDQDFSLVCYNCTGSPDFAISVTPAAQSVCAPDSATYTVNVTSFSGFSDPVTMQVSGQPAGAAATLAPNPVTPTAASTLTVAGTAAAGPATYNLTVSGAGGALARQATAALTVFTRAPSAAALNAPADGSTGASVRPTFTWNAAEQGETYELQVAADPAFGQLVINESVQAGSSYTPTAALAADTVYYWRVNAHNRCGSQPSATHAFRTAEAPDCTDVIADGGFEAGEPNPVWSESSSRGYEIIYDTEGFAHSGMWFAWLGGLDDEDSQIWQAPEIAAPADSATLNYWYLIASSDMCDYDYGYVKINGTAVQTFDLCEETDTGEAYLAGSYDLSAYRGTAPEVRFQAVTDESIYSSFFIDDVTLDVCHIQAARTADYSDLAGSYGAAWHTGDGALRLGAGWTADASFAAGSDNATDDGVAFVGQFAAGQPATLRVDVRGTPANGRWLRAWLDWNNNGVFDMAEQVYNNTVAAGSSDLVFNVPETAAAAVKYRVRLYDSEHAPPAADDSALGAHGGGDGGEVEDGDSPRPVYEGPALYLPLVLRP